MEYSRNLKRGLCSHDADQQAQKTRQEWAKKKKKKLSEIAQSQMLNRWYQK